MESLLDSRPSLQELMQQVCLESRWHEIGVMLDLNSEKLDAIRYSSVSERTKTNDMYKLWLDSKPQATRRELVQVLKDMELNRQAAEYKEYLRHQSIENTTLRPRSTRPVPKKSSVILPPLKNVTKSTAEWLHSTTPNDVVQNEEVMKIQIEDILKPVSEERLRFVLIEGEPGIGKSTLAKELVLRWAKGSDELMNNYDIVFLIQLRFETYHKATSIEHLFVDLDDQSINMTELHVEIKKRKGAGILWILDGFDELPSHLKSNSVLMKLIKGDNLSKSTVIVTSRPVASDQLLHFLHEHDSKRISLRGFDSTKIEEYALQYFNDKDKASKFHSYYSGNIVIESMLYNPLNCFIVCTIFNDFIATNNKQYPKTMTSLYNHYVRILLKRHLIDAGFISDLDYDMPQRLMLETDFNDPLLQSVWKNFSFLSKIAYDGVMNQQYIFGKELCNVDKMSMMDTIANFFVFEKDESSSFLHTTLQEYFAAVYLANNKQDIEIRNIPSLKVIFIFYVGIRKIMGARDMDYVVFDILKNNISQYTDNGDEYVDIGSVLLGCLYEDDSLLYNIGLPVNHSFYSRSPNTNFDYYILGYLVAVHKSTYKIGFSNSDQIKAFNKGLQSHSTVSGKLLLRFLIKGFDERHKGFKELLLMPSHLVIEILILPSNYSEISEFCGIISRFPLLQEVLLVTPALQWPSENPLLKLITPALQWSSENPLLKLKKLNILSILAINLDENDFARLKLGQLVTPGRPLKKLYVENYCIPYNDILNLIKMQTSLEELVIQDRVDTHGTLTYSLVWNLELSGRQHIQWTKSTNNLMVHYYEKFFYHLKKRKLPTIRLSSFTSFTYIKNRNSDYYFKSVDMLSTWNSWTRVNVTVYSKSTTFKLNHFIDAFSECIILLKKLPVERIDKTITKKLKNNFTCMFADAEQGGGFIIGLPQCDHKCHNTEYDSAINFIVKTFILILITVVLNDIKHRYNQ
uniref:NACHT domain-containing protein n=1 Tax=Amphimedon queenslandica TaxID=400682 RepID=A0A1X7VQK1_AMPQE